MKICNNCRKEDLPEDANFCSKCGKQLDPKKKIRLVDYDHAWRTIIFKRYFNKPEYTLRTLLAPAGKVYRDKCVLDYLFGFRGNNDDFDKMSVWGITDEILKQYPRLATREGYTKDELATEIGDAITGKRSL